MKFCLLSAAAPGNRSGSVVLHCHEPLGVCCVCSRCGRAKTAVAALTKLLVGAFEVVVGEHNTTAVLWCRGLASWEKLSSRDFFAVGARRSYCKIRSCVIMLSCFQRIDPLRPRLPESRPSYKKHHAKVLQVHFRFFRYMRQ